MKSLIVTGPSGVGKGTLIRYLCLKMPQLCLTLSYTTRNPRQNQKHGVHYLFVTKQQFNELGKKGSLLQQTQIYGNFYGTSYQHYNEIVSIGKIPVLDVDANGVQSLNRIKDETAKLCLLPPNLAILQERLRGRKSQTEQQVSKRLQQNLRQIEKLKQLRFKTNIHYVSNFQYQLTGFAIKKWMMSHFNLHQLSNTQ